MEGGNRPFNMAEMWANSKALAKQMEDKRAKGMEGMSGLDKLALSTMATPIVGDIAGLAADAQRFYQDPESRTPTNFGLSALGAIPFVPYMGAMTRGMKSASPQDIKRISAAQSLENAGVPRETILEQTGWWKGPDKQWRTEISDQPSRITDNVFDEIKDKKRFEGPVSQALSHDELYKYYPELGETKATLFASADPSGTYNSATGEILAGGPGTGSQRNVMLHELQHGVQGEELFARGGSPEEAADIVGGEISKLRGEAGRMSMGDTPYSEKRMQLNINKQKQLERLSDQDIYERLAGEAEARAVQARRNLTPQQRAARPFWMDFDVPESDQIVRFR
jgi:hypothetical protein